MFISVILGNISTNKSATGIFGFIRDIVMGVICGFCCMIEMIIKRFCDDYISLDLSDICHYSVLIAYIIYLICLVLHQQSFIMIYSIYWYPSIFVVYILL